jgi:hypothetical protein
VVIPFRSRSCCCSCVMPYILVLFPVTSKLLFRGVLRGGRLSRLLLWRMRLLPFGRSDFLQGGTVCRFLGCLGLLRGRHSGHAGRASITQDPLGLLRGGIFSLLCLSRCCEICSFFLRNKRTTQWDMVPRVTSTCS